MTLWENSSESIQNKKLHKFINLLYICVVLETELSCSDFTATRKIFVSKID